MSTLRCTFTLGPADFLALQGIVARRTGRRAGSRGPILALQVLGWVALAFFVFRLTTLARAQPRMAQDLAVLALSLGAFGLCLVAAEVLYRQARQQVLLSPRSAFLAEQTFELSPTGLVAHNRHGEARYAWSAFEDVAEDEARLYLFFEPTQALVLPKAAVGGDDVQARLRAWLSAPGTPPPDPGRTAH